MATNPLNQPDSQQPKPPDRVIGTPEEDTARFPGKQSHPDTCAVRCQEFIIEQFTGQDIPENQLVQEARDMGIYTPGRGTMPEDVGKLLELHGIEVTRNQDATTFDLTKELAQGHKVIIGVDSGELWGTDNPILTKVQETMGIVDGADHAVVVSGIDTSDPNNVKVIVSDPGTGAAAAAYPLKDFVAAWEDSSFEMVTTKEPVPDSQPEMTNFPYDTGHLPSVVGMPYDQFVQYQDNPAAFDTVINDPYPSPAPPTPDPGFDPLIDPDPIPVPDPMPVPEPDPFTLEPVSLDPIEPNPFLPPEPMGPQDIGPGPVDPTLDPGAERW